MKEASVEASGGILCICLRIIITGQRDFHSKYMGMWAGMEKVFSGKPCIRTNIAMQSFTNLFI